LEIKEKIKNLSDFKTCYLKSGFDLQKKDGFQSQNELGVLKSEGLNYTYPRTKEGNGPKHRVNPRNLASFVGCGVKGKPPPLQSRTVRPATPPLSGILGGKKGNLWWPGGTEAPSNSNPILKNPQTKKKKEENLVRV